MSFNFFDWVRDGVKHSVLLGVSDAVNTMGMPHDDSSKDKILSFLQSPAGSEAPAARRLSSTAGSNKRLGRSLNELRDAS